MDCLRPIMSVLPRFYPTWSSRTRPSMGVLRSEGLGVDATGEPVKMKLWLQISGKLGHRCTMIWNPELHKLGKI